jgi:hypothetical protein
VNVVILIAGVVGLAAACYFLVELIVGAIRRRAWLDIVVAVVVVLLTVWLLVAHSDRLLQ